MEIIWKRMAIRTSENFRRHSIFKIFNFWHYTVPFWGKPLLFEKRAKMDLTMDCALPSALTPSSAIAEGITRKHTHRGCFHPRSIRAHYGLLHSTTRQQNSPTRCDITSRPSSRSKYRHDFMRFSLGGLRGTNTRKLGPTPPRNFALDAPPNDSLCPPGTPGPLRRFDTTTGPKEERRARLVGASSCIHRKLHRRALSRALERSRAGKLSPLRPKGNGPSPSEAGAEIGQSHTTACRSGRQSAPPTDNKSKNTRARAQRQDQQRPDGPFLRMTSRLDLSVGRLKGGSPRHTARWFGLGRMWLCARSAPLRRT